MGLGDRFANLALLAAAALGWIMVALVVTTRDPIADPNAGYGGALLIGISIALTVAPIYWLVAFALHRRIAYHGDWARALRRGAWTGGLLGVFVALRLIGALELPLALFMAAIVVLAEATLTSRA